MYNIIFHTASTSIGCHPGSPRHKNIILFFKTLSVCRGIYRYYCAVCVRVFYYFFFLFFRFLCPRTTFLQEILRRPSISGMLTGSKYCPIIFGPFGGGTMWFPKRLWKTCVKFLLLFFCNSFVRTIVAIFRCGIVVEKVWAFPELC